MEMKANLQSINWTMIISWMLTGLASFVLSLLLAWIPLSIFNSYFGETIQVAGESRITEDYLLGYAFIPCYGLVIGLLQALLLKFKFSHFLWWLLFTSIGWGLVFLGISAYYNPLAGWNLPHFMGLTVSAGIILGALLGTFQWLVLRQYRTHPGWWIPANILGFGLLGWFFYDITGILDAVIGLSMPVVLTGIGLIFMQRASTG